MNRTFKIIFNAVRGALMVTNEATSSVQKKGTTTLVATAVAAALSCGVAVGAEHNYPQDTGNKGFASTQTEATFAAGDVLNMTVTGQTDTRAYGLLATGQGAKYTNQGTINLNLATEDASPSWRVKGMMADNGGTAINDGTINVKNAHGMTVGSTGKNSIINNQLITVENGVAMEIAPTGATGTEAGQGATGTNNGTITVKSGTGVLMAGDGGTFVNAGTLDAKGNTALLVQREAGKTTVNNTITFKAGSVTKGDVAVKGYVVEENEEDVAYKVKGTKITFEEGSSFDGRIVVSRAEGTQIDGQLNIANQTALNGGAMFLNDSKAVVDIPNSHFEGNKVVSTAKDSGAAGGAIYSYADKFVQTGGSYVNNSAVSTGYDTLSKNGVIQDGASSGALFIKGNNPVTFTDVLFQGNSAVANKGEATHGGFAYGGAILADYSTGTGDGTGEHRKAAVSFDVTKDMTYSGNTISSDSSDTYFDTYGYHMPHAAAGGFLFLDRGTVADFNVAEGATLNIGATVTDDDTDSIASSIPNTGTDNNNGQHALINKTGAGTLAINSSLNKYYGTVVISAGRMEVNSAWDIKNAVTVDSGATLSLASFTLADAATSGNQDKDGNAIGGSLTVEGTLQTTSDLAFTNKASDTAEAAGELTDTMKKVTFSGGTLALADETYTLAYAQSAGNVFSTAKIDGQVVLLGNIAGVVDNTVTLDQIENVSGDVGLNSATVDAENQDVQIGGTASAGVAHRANSLSVGAVDLGTADTVTVTGGQSLNLAGVNGALITSSADNVTVNVTGTGTELGLGGVAAQGGTLEATVNLAENTQMKVTGGAHYEVAAITGAGTVVVGDESSAGRLTINSIDGMTGMIFVDPAFVDGVAQIGDASQVSINVGAPITADIVVGQNSVVSLGATADEAVSAYEKIASASGLSWKDDVTAALYVGAPISLAQNGGVEINGSLTSVPTGDLTGGIIAVREKGMLITDQSVATSDTPLITGKVNFDSNSYLGIVNAAEGSFKLSTSSEGSAEVVTDNPFIGGSVNNGTVTTQLDVDNGLVALASTGIQAMTRRADSVLAQTIADRTSIDQELKEGVNLWVDVVGESIEADNFDRGGEFKADMGYGAFGSDVTVDNFTFGGAFQYGSGSLRSSVSNIKNSIDNYGVSLYGTYKPTDSVKLAAELAYVWGENDITSSQTAFNQTVDTEMYSFGLRAMYEAKAGNFSFVPSIGVRVSQLSTDAMKVGSVKIDDQDQTLVQVPIALRITADDFKTAGWTVAPSMKIAYVPTFGDKEIEVFHHSEDVIDTSPVQADFGLRVGKDNMLFNVNMLLGCGKLGTSTVGGKVGFKYVF